MDKATPMSSHMEKYQLPLLLLLEHDAIAEANEDGAPIM